MRFLRWKGHRLMMEDLTFVPRLCRGGGAPAGSCPPLTFSPADGIFHLSSLVLLNVYVFGNRILSRLAAGRGSPYLPIITTRRPESNWERWRGRGARLPTGSEDRERSKQYPSCRPFPQV